MVTIDDVVMKQQIYRIESRKHNETKRSLNEINNANMQFTKKVFSVNTKNLQYQRIGYLIMVELIEMIVFGVSRTCWWCMIITIISFTVVHLFIVNFHRHIVDVHSVVIDW